MPGYVENSQIVAPEELFNGLIEEVKKYNSDEKGLQKLEQAFQTASRAHANQFRASGEPYISHPLEVAFILAELKMDIPTLVAAILHDVVEDTPVKYEEIKEHFGKIVAELVDGVTKLAAISASNEKGEAYGKGKSKLDNQAENLRKIFLAMARDIRVILIKEADRLHNLRTLDALPEHKQKFIARETLDIYAPIASRLGMWEFKWQLEDLAFRYLEPEKYRELARQVMKRRKEREDLIAQVKNELRKSLEEMNLKDIHIEGRPKHLYSIYKKMLKKGISIDEIYDISAVRVIVDTIRECYQVLGVVHNLWMPLQHRFKDFIAMPKSNNYRSLHTTVYGPGNQPVEVQIRTWEMHKVNEFGIAAHWAYKESVKSFDANVFSEVYPWIRRILDWEGESKDAREYIENLKLDLLDSEVFVFTPKGDVIDLPAGSTPLDFAYRIHTEVGHRFIGAKVNSKIVPLEYHLKNADIVEILTSKHGTPSRDWLKIAATPSAKNKVRQWFKRERRDENIARGKDAVLGELKRNRIDVSLNNDEIFGKISERYNFNSIEDLFASVGYGETSAMTIVNRVQELLPADKTPKLPEPPQPEALKRKEKLARKSKSPIIIPGLDNPLVKFSKCCSPVRGDDIFGYITHGKGVSIHRKDCPNVADLSVSKERMVPVYWADQAENLVFTVELEIIGDDRSGLLSDVMNVTNDLKYYVHSAKAWAKDGHASIKIAVDVSSRGDMDALVKKLKSVKSVTGVFRATRRTF